MIWNVLTSVVELVEADSAEEAIAVLHGRLSKWGFTPFVDAGSDCVPSAFESEPL